MSDLNKLETEVLGGPNARLFLVSFNCSVLIRAYFA